MAVQPGCVVVGAGLASANVVQTLREDGYDRPVTLVGNEGERPYERPPLSKSYLQGSTEAAEAYVHDEQWYADHDVDLRLDDAAVSLDRQGAAVVLASGERLPYAHAVLATGARPRVPGLPGADLDGVRYLRTLRDSTALRDRLGQDGRWVVVGGGWIGLEVAAAARQAGRDVTVLEQAQLPLLGVLGEAVGRHFADLHRSHGVDLRTGVSVTGIEGSGGTVTGVRTDEGTIAADLVLVAVGVVPNADLATAAGLAVDNGVLVDQRLRTEDPAVLAAGDLANAVNTSLGDRLRVEHWDNAIRQGRLAARSVLGREDAYDWQPYFYTDQFDLGMEYVGRNGRDDEVVVRGDQDRGEFIAFWTADGVVTAAMNVNIWDVNDDLRAVVGRSVPAERLRDPDVALGEL
jgi:3-phenylpropionate/trans-cinnamate dioxygenase ferredoxin reductase subunit